MGLSESEWWTYKAHMYAVARREGACYVLLDNNGEPVGEFTPISVDSTQTNLDFGETTFTVGLGDGGGFWNPVVEAYFPLWRLGGYDGDSPLDPGVGVEFLLMIQGPGGERDRQVFTVEYVTLDGDEQGPETLTLHAMDILAALQFCPCPSVPATWKEPYRTWNNDAGKPYRVGRELSPMQMATMATNHTLRGPAVPIISRVIQESLDARDRVRGWLDDPSEVVELPLRKFQLMGPEVLVRRTDDSVWDTIAPVCRNTGVTVTARMWLPGDKDIRRVPYDSRDYGVDNFKHFWGLGKSMRHDRPIIIYTVNVVEDEGPREQ